jgi:hypothetical protein
VQKSLILFVFCALLGVIACNGTMNLKPTDLKQYGIPLTIMAPEGATIAAEDLGGNIGLTIQKDKFDVQVMAITIGAASAAEFIQEKKTELQGSDPTFKIIDEDEDGFVYETKTDKETTYNFSFVKFLGDKHYTFQTGFTALPTQAEAEEMYKAMRSAK